MRVETDTLFYEDVVPRLHTAWAGRHYYYYDEVDSTNTQAKVLAGRNAPHGSLVVAKTQLSGRGRRGRSWISQTGEAIAMSVVLRPDMEQSRASMLTLVAAMAVEKVVQAYLREETVCWIKWPNDLVVNGKKICGILTEMTTQGSDISSIVVGIGLNVNTRHFDGEVAQIATSLALETGRTYRRSELVADLMDALEQYYELFMQTQDFSRLRTAYNQRLINCDRQVRVVEAGEEQLVIAKGITDMGALLVEDADGSQREIISGEVSVRGVLGYV